MVTPKRSYNGDYRYSFESEPDSTLPKPEAPSSKPQNPKPYTVGNLGP